MTAKQPRNPQLATKVVSDSVIEKRNIFLAELRSGKYTKGCIKSDERTGWPIFEKESDRAENTACSCAIMGILFGQTQGGKISLPKATKALGLDSKDCRFIQRNINDRHSTLHEDAEIIETLFFNSEKFELVYKNFSTKLKQREDFTDDQITEFLKTYNEPPIERILIEKIIYDFKNSGQVIEI